MRVPKSMILCALAVSGLLLVLFTTCPAQEGHLVATEANPRFADTQNNEGERSKLPPNALQIARIIGLESDIEKLSSLAAKGAGAAPGLCLEELSLRQQITDAVIAASLDVDSVAAEIDYEREQTVELRSLWRYKRDRAIGSTNLAVLAAGTGLSIVSGLLQFSKTTSSAGNAIGFAAGGLSTLFSLRSFRQVHSGKRPAWVSRKQVLEPAILDLNQVIWEAHKLLRRLVPANIDIVPVLDPALGRVKADPGQIQQILINMAANARDAMPQGGKVTIETANTELDESYRSQHLGVQPGAYVMLTVRDTGSGMDAETLSRIFEPFFTTKEQDKGTGLGLSTIYGIVKQSGGHIDVESSLGKGTVFRIYLPRAEGQVEQSEPAVPQPEELGGSETILVVEDETALRRLICLSLERRGYKVLAAKDGTEAIEICQRSPSQIQLVLSDIMMPHVNGLQLRERTATLCPDAKFLFMSGYSEEIVGNLLAQGCAFLEKPFLPDELVGKVRELLRGEAAA